MSEAVDNPSNGVSVDPEGMELLAGEMIDNYANNYLKYLSDLYSLIASNLTEEKTEESVWWGPNAVAFKEILNNKEATFKDAYNAICSYSSNLTEQSDSWKTFENII